MVSLPNHSRVRWRWRFWLSALCVWVIVALATVCPATAKDAEDYGGSLEIEIETLPEVPYEQEMLLLTIKGSYPFLIALNELEQPAFRNFSWMQLGRDRWFEIPGVQKRGFERVMAIFPKRGGTLKIEPFIHHLTLLAPDGHRIKHDVVSDPVTINVRAKPAGSSWWFPARGVRVTDRWNRPPDQLAPGQSAVRTVSMEADGIGPALLPPMPRMRSPALITFADPGERTTTLTPQGPISRVVWRWTFKPATSAPVDLAPVIIPWFDTLKREHREILLGPQRIALAGSAGNQPHSDRTLRKLASYILPLGLLIGFLGGLTLLMPGLRLKSRKEIAGLFQCFIPDRHVWALRYAARKNDPAHVRRAIHQLMSQDEEAGRDYSLPPKIREGMAMIDARLYGPQDKRTSSLNLRCFVREYLSARRSAKLRAL